MTKLVLKSCGSRTFLFFNNNGWKRESFDVRKRNYDVNKKTVRFNIIILLYIVPVYSYVLISVQSLLSSLSVMVCREELIPTRINFSFAILKSNIAFDLTLTILSSRFCQKVSSISFLLQPFNLYLSPTISYHYPNKPLSRWCLFHMVLLSILPQFLA